MVGAEGPNTGVTRMFPARIAKNLDLPIFNAPMITEGGAIEIDDAGTFMATKSSIVNQNRNPEMDQQAVERVLREYLGVRHFIWLSGASPAVCESLGDGTDWHVDIAARFTPNQAILYCWTDDESDPRYPYLVQHRKELEGATDANGKPFELIPIQNPEVYSVNDIKWSASHRMKPGSFTDAAYTNYLVTNGAMLAPVYGRKEDECARRSSPSTFRGGRSSAFPHSRSPRRAARSTASPSTSLARNRLPKPQRMAIDPGEGERHPWGTSAAG